MARYNRDFLVPYLRDVCTLELMRARLWQTIELAQGRINYIKSLGVTPVRWEPPVRSYTMPIICVVVAVVVAIWASGYDARVSLGQAIMGLLLWWGFGICLMGAYLFLKWSKEEFESDEREYKEDRHRYVREKEAFERGQKELPHWCKQLADAQEEYRKVDGLLRKLYAVNIIPGNESTYRNLYAAVYLYDYFSNSRADDLDMVINTFVLEQIKAKLDVIIRQQSEMLINQSIMIANQERQEQQQLSFQTQMQKKVSQIQASQAEQTMYLEMIDSHVQATAYFAAANYFKN